MTYEGEVDLEGKACGYGLYGNREIYVFEGTFFNGKMHGICK